MTTNPGGTLSLSPRPTAPIVLDSDPGIDDAVALQYLLGTGLWDLKAYTTVGGNVPAEQTYRNGRALARAFGIDADVPVHRGAGRPLTRLPYSAAGEFHGDAGLGDVRLPDSTAAEQTEPSAQALLRLSREYEGELTVCATGPLTNVALALTEDPGFAARVKRLVFMGGAAEVPGNITPVAEFNAWADPDAVDLVVSSGITYTMVGLDATHGWRFGTEELATLEAAGDGMALSARLMRFYLHAYQEANGSPLHDPLAVGVCADESFVTAADGTVVVECASELTRGKTVFIPYDADYPRAYYQESPLVSARTAHRGRVALGTGARNFTEDFVNTILKQPATGV
ncbi:nucleoside hydrolase [Streptomyces longispororuber]|uniref:nucleoside hydrolase n=1 Tax=Streptomyces longispororuber TaxID=68230 RepID=UPI00210B1529|nr:nucleoside hydrolase [Streptomyces longispororuber]MCQ4208423.1 nucleoside hydrolase [Streptomyces longispororuber]